MLRPSGWVVSYQMDIKTFLERLRMRGKPYSPSKLDIDGVDRISQLSDKVITHLMAFLPLNRDGATSLLSRRWTHLWKDIPNLIFNDYYLQHNLYHLYGRDHIMPDEHRESKFRMNKYIDWVNSVLRSYRARSLCCFTIIVLVDKSNQHQVTKWLDFAFARRVKRLKLISDKSWVNVGVLADMLKDMRTPSSDFKSIWELRLKGFRMSSEAIEFLLRNCVVLESLVLKMLYLTSDLEVVGGSLKHLDMRMPFNQSFGYVKVCASNLTQLTVDHDPKKLLLENVPNLINMTFYCRTMDTMHDFASVAAQLEALTIVLIHPLASFSMPQMSKLKKLVVYYSLHDKSVLFPVTRLVRASPVLEEFKMEIGELTAGRDIFQISDYDPLLHQHLRRFVLSGLCSDRVELVRYMASYCVALEEIVVGRGGLVRDSGNYCIPMEHGVWRPTYTRKEYVATEHQQRRDIEKVVRLFTPDHIRLRVV